MKRVLLSIITLLLALTGLAAREFDQDFENATLRLDYVFCGDHAHQAIYFQQALRTSVWAGRRHNLSAPLLEGNGQIRVLDPETGECLYANSFSTLFQEWQVEEEATRVQRAFENCFQAESDGQRLFFHRRLAGRPGGGDHRHRRGLGRL